MKRRAQWLAVVGSATLGLAGLAGCQSMGGYPSGSWSGDRSMVRAAEPDDPTSVPSLQLHPTESSATHSAGAPVEDPFAPISVEQLLPATSHNPNASMSDSHVTAPAGYISPPPPITLNSGALIPPAPMAVMHPTPVGPSPLMTDAHAWDPHAALNGTCPQCGHKGGSGNMYTSLVENMVIFAGADYFQNSGALDRTRLFNAAASLNVIPVDIPDLDPTRMGGMLSLNAGAPLTPDGDIGFQIGGTYVQTNVFGAQGFFTLGFFHRCEPCEKCGINWGAVFDIHYDEWIDFAIGQLRFKAGYPLTSRDEIGGWLAVGTNTELVDVPVTTIIVGTTGPKFVDTINAHVRPEAHGYFFWRHVLTCGAEGSFFVGGRENLGGTLVLGATAQVPITDCWSIMGGGHWSNDSNDIGSWDAYLGVGFYPGGNARSVGACGNRFLPYQDAANNTFMPTSVHPRFIQVETDRAPL